MTIFAPHLLYFRQIMITGDQSTVLTGEFKQYTGTSLTISRPC